MFMGIARLKKMEGNAKIIKFICRDENVHLAGHNPYLNFSQTMIRILSKLRKKQRRPMCKSICFLPLEQRNKNAADYLFKDGSIVEGLNYQLLASYVEWIANKENDICWIADTI